jgi:hypothetical protein
MDPLLTFKVMQSVSLHPSLTGYISKGIALCGKNRLQDAIRAFDLASVFTNSDSETTLLLLVKVRTPIFLGIPCFNTDLRPLHFSMQISTRMQCYGSKGWLIFVPAPILLRVVSWK